MKITIDLPDDLYRQAKTEAARSGRKLEDMVEEGLRLVLAGPRRGRRNRPQPTLLELMKDGIGIIHSGVPDLSTNLKYLADYGRSAQRPGRSTRR